MSELVTKVGSGCSSSTKTSTGKPLSSATSAPSDSKATTCPSALRAAFPAAQLNAGLVPSGRTLDRTVLWVWRSWTKLSVSKLPSPATRLSAAAVNATSRPSALIEADDDRSVVAAGMVTSWRMEAAAQTSAEHTTHFRQSTSRPAARFPRSACPRRLLGCRVPAGLELAHHEDDEAERGSEGRCAACRPRRRGLLDVAILTDP